MLVREYMSPKVFSIPVDKKMFAVQQIMEWAHVRHIPVVDSARHLVGIVSHRDLLRASVASVHTRIAKAEQHQHLWYVSIRDIMHTDVQTISPEAPVQQAARMMREHKIGCLPVLANGELMGIITESDLLRVVEQVAA